MGTEEPKDPLKGVDWKAIGSELQNDPSTGAKTDWKAIGSELQNDPSTGAKTIVKKRLPKKIRQIPDYYFLPRRSLPSAVAVYGACITGGVGAGMLLEVWINKKVKEDGGIIWEFDK